MKNRDAGVELGLSDELRNELRKRADEFQVVREEVDSCVTLCDAGRLDRLISMVNTHLAGKYLGRLGRKGSPGNCENYAITFEEVRGMRDRTLPVMKIAFVLINTKPRSEGEVLQSLKEIEGVKEAYSVYGVYDIVAKIEAKSMDKLKDIVTFKIRRLNTVRTALIMIVTK